MFTKLGNISQMVSAIAAIFPVIFTYYTVTTSWKSLEEDKKSKRPYFISVNSGVKEQEPRLGSLFRIQIPIQNIGIHPAANVTRRIIIIEVSSTGELKQSYILADDELSGELPQGIINFWTKNVPDVRIPLINTKYIVMLIKYKDAILGNTYSQKFYMKWHGDPEGKGYVRYLFEHVIVNEANSIDEFCKKTLLTNS